MPNTGIYVERILGGGKCKNIYLGLPINYSNSQTGKGVRTIRILDGLLFPFLEGSG